jgi:hypothetical protein
MTMNDVFDGIRIENAAGQPVDVAYLRQRFGKYLSATWDQTRWTLDRIYLPEGAMTCWISVQNEAGAPVAGFPVAWGWPDGSVPTATDNNGLSNWVIGNAIWIDGAGTDAQHARGPYFADGGGFHVEGIGWAGGTNHQKPCFYFRQITGHAPTPPPDGGPLLDIALVKKHLNDIQTSLDAIRAILA